MKKLSNSISRTSIGFKNYVNEISVHGTLKDAWLSNISNSGPVHNSNVYDISTFFDVFARYYKFKRFKTKVIDKLHGYYEHFAAPIDIDMTLYKLTYR